MNEAMRAYNEQIESIRTRAAEEQPISRFVSIIWGIGVSSLVSFAFGLGVVRRTYEFWVEIN